MNGDGIADFIIGAPGSPKGSFISVIHVIFGSPPSVNIITSFCILYNTIVDMWDYYTHQDFISEKYVDL